MASYVNVFLKTEITVIPSLLDKYFGKNYNVLCNGGTWMFLIWYLLHVVFDICLNALLKKMRYKEYIRIRLKRSLWYLGFYIVANIYSFAILYKNNIQFFDLKSSYSNSDLPSEHLILGFVILTTFYLHSTCWESIKYCYGLLALNNFCLFFVIFLSYWFQFMTEILRLTILVSITQVALQLTHCITLLLGKQILCGKALPWYFLTGYNLCFIINYITVLPLVFGFPFFGKYGVVSPLMITSFFFLLVWLTLETYSSVLVKYFIHQFKHCKENTKASCGNDLFECALFPPRDEESYYFLLLRKEIKEREEKSLLLRRPKNRTMVMQTLKCMVAIKKKLNEKRRFSNKEDVSQILSEKLEQALNESCNNSEVNQNNEREIYPNKGEVIGGKLQFHIQSNKLELNESSSNNKMKED